MARRFGMSFQTEVPRAGLSLTLGTEVTHPRDVAVSYGTLANDGRFIGYTQVLRVTNSSGEDLVAAVRAAAPATPSCRPRRRTS